MSEQKMIFIFADEAKIIRRLSSQINKLGFKTAGTANTDKDAIGKIAAIKPDIVLIDIEFKSDMNLIETAAVIRDKYSTPVIFLADESGISDLQGFQKNGLYGYIIKPSTTAKLNIAILNLLNRRRIERRISNREEQLRAILNAQSGYICIIDDTGRIIMANNQWEKFADNNPTPLGKVSVGANYILNCESAQGENRKAAVEFASGIKEIIRGVHGNFSKEFISRQLDGDRWYKGIATSLSDISRGTIGVLISHVDITDVKLAEKELIEKNNLFNSIMETTPNGIYVKDLNGRYIFLNNSALSFLNKNADEVLGRDDMSIFPEAEAAAIMECDRRGMTNKIVQVVEERRTVRPGEIRTFITLSGPVYDINGEIKGLFGITHDITKRKKIEETLKKSNRDFYTLVENASDLIIRYDINFRYMYCNKAVEREFGIPVAYLIGKTPLQVEKFRESADSVIESLKKSLEYGEEIIVDEKYTFTPVEQWFQKRIVPEFNENGEIESLLAISRNITEYKKAMDEIKQYQNHLQDLVRNRTKELFKSEKRYREILNSITDYVYQVKIDEYKNVSAIYTEKFSAFTGYKPYEFIDDHKLWLKIIYKDDQPMFKNFLRNIFADHEHAEKNIEHRIITKNGFLRWVRNTVIIHKNFKGILTGYDGVINDITEIKNAEEEIKQLNLNIIKLQEEERKRVAENLHDSVGQTILAAKLNIDTYKQDPEYFADQLDVGLSFIIQASRELREIYMNLYPTVLNDLGFEMAIRWLVQNTLEKMNIKTDIISKMKKQLPHNVEVALYRIIQEIISNILKHASASRVYLSLTGNEDKFVLLVKDDGKGFNPGEKKEKISGYGLANIKNRVSGLNGKIFIETNYPHGTVISINIDLRSEIS